ncbi:DUF6776 family protein [Lysobacter niastensis]|uniref:Transmembrane protein n=1 Tax=Lysobacter niastensis TaxID=380629 RepID=A0ABS0B5I2_9GAMM|nr:DUF6776 family protein [Lysobacter niastensis]MBF6024129.1 hypothetical protein [Lysobacter niastensis]
MIVQQHRDRRPLVWAGAAVLWAASIGATWLWAQQLAAPRLPQLSAELDRVRDELRQWHRQAESLRQREATLQRSDQISRNANQQVQGELAEREQEIAALRANVAFYERLVGATSQPKGLAVYSAAFVPEAGGTWRYEMVLTQSLNRGAVSNGKLQFALEGVRHGKLTTIGWDELHQRPAAPPQDYSFRYFQQVAGSVMLPAGFTPQRVRVSLRGDGGTVEQMLGWKRANTIGDT